MAETGYEFTKPAAPGEAGKVGTLTPGKPSEGKEVDKDKCPRCRKAGTLRDRNTGFPCCPKTIRVCEDCRHTVPK